VLSLETGFVPRLADTSHKPSPNPYRYTPSYLYRYCTVITRYTEPAFNV